MSPANLVIDGGRILQIDDLVRATHVSIKDRSNKSTTISFSVNREHKSYADAQVFCLEHNEELPGVGALRIDMRKDNGGLIARLCERAGLQGVRTYHKGCRTESSYVFICGEFITPKS